MVKHRSVTQILAVTKTGLKDFMLQRLSALLILFYAIFWIGFFATHPSVSSQEWAMLFSHPWLKIASFLVLVMILIHARIGLWIVLTDYVHKTALRVFLLAIFFLVFFACLLWGILTLWG